MLELTGLGHGDFTDNHQIVCKFKVVFNQNTVSDN